MSAHHDDIRRRARAREGTVLRGKYRLDKLLGIGGMASVYAATHRNNKNRVAIKVLHAELSVNSDVRARFLREGYVANTVEHSGVTRVLDDDLTDEGAVFLVMDLLEGESLGKRSDRCGGKLPCDDVLAITIELLGVLEAAHAKGIVHRDIKPENVFITRSGVVKILDFGIARLHEGNTNDASTSTQTGQMVGTPAFMAPEQALGRSDEIGPRTDLWAVGATMFTLLTGKFAHEARSNNELMVFAATKPVRSIRSVDPDLPESLAAAVDKSLAFERDARWPDAATMRAELESILRALRPDGHRVARPPTASEQLALEDTDTRDRADMFGSTQLKSSIELDPTVASNPGERVASGASAKDAPRTLSSGSAPKSEHGPTTTMGVTSDRARALAASADNERPAPRRGRVRAAVLISLLAVCVVGAIAIGVSLSRTNARNESAAPASAPTTEAPAATTSAASTATASATASATTSAIASATATAGASGARPPPRANAASPTKTTSQPSALPATPSTTPPPPRPPANPLDRQ